MRQFRQVLPCLVAFLVFVLHCSQACVSHTHAGVTTLTAQHHSKEHGKERAACHAPQTAPHESSEQCLDCGGHVFLPSASDGTQPLPALLSSSLQLNTSGWWREFLGSSPPRYLSLSVFRL